jgi:beta-alanine--pyruvate transaminase
MTEIPNDFDSFWMPFTARKLFKDNPRLIAKADGIWYETIQGHRVIDGTGGLWSVNAGHNQPHIVEAIQRQAAKLDFAHNFNQGHAIAFQAASRLVELAPGFDHVFLTNSGSEAVDTALKIALGYHVARGEGHRRIFVSRGKAYHGINFGGTSVQGIAGNRVPWGPLYPHVAHMRATGVPENVMSRGRPTQGAWLAEDLASIIEINGGQSIAAVIVEPVIGAGGVYPPPIGYLERLRELCTQHGILLIFDEVITGFGRLGANFASHAYGVTPDLFTVAKGITNSTVPMGAVYVPGRIREAFAGGPAHLPDLFHGYTYSGHPLACAATIATLDVYRDQGIFENAAKMAPLWEDMLHSLADIPGIVDIRNAGLLGAVQIESGETVGLAGRAAYERLWDLGLSVRPIGDSLAMSPPLTLTADDIGRIGELMRAGLQR